MAKKRKTEERNIITLTDETGTDHVFEPLELFVVGKKNFALLRPIDAVDGEAQIFKFTPGEDENSAEFASPSKKEFDAAVKVLEAAAECDCDCEEGECHGQGEGEGEGEDACMCACGCEEAPAKPAKKAAPKKAARRAAKKAAKPAAKAAKKPAVKKPAVKKAAGGRK